MISITNKGPFNDRDPEGWRDYEIKINNDIIATFRHIRSDGLFVCLEKASEAAAMNCHSMRNNKGGEMKKLEQAHGLLEQAITTLEIIYNIGGDLITKDELLFGAIKKIAKAQELIYKD